MKKVLIFFFFICSLTMFSQVERPLKVVQDVINNLYQSNTFLRNENLLPAYVPRMTDTVYSPYNCPPSYITALLDTPKKNEGKTLQIYDASFSTFFVYSDGVNWIVSAVAYNTLSDYGIYFNDSIYNDWGVDTYLAPDENWPGDSVPPDVNSGHITFHVSNYPAGVSIPITVFDIFTASSCECVSGMSPGWIEIDGEAPFWYDWQRNLSNDSVVFTYTIDKSKIDFGDSTRVIGRLEFSYPTSGPGSPVTEPYPGKSFAIKIMKDTPH